MRALTRIKICGLSRAEHVHAAVAAGTHAVGFNFVDGSPRRVPTMRAAGLAAELTPFVATVGLFVDATPELVRSVLAEVHLQSLQFQGDEDDAYCASFGLPFVKAIRVSAPVDGAQLAKRFPRAAGIQLDAAVQGKTGGTGVRFDWAWFPQSNEKPWILAGGLNPTNVGAAIEQLSPYAVDVSSGVESSPGTKDAQLIQAFCDAVRAADERAAGH